MSRLQATEDQPGSWGPVDVVFRVWRASREGPDGSVLALFPTLPADVNGLVTSYEHLGQHGGANYGHCIRSSRPATPREYEALKQELIRIGYRLTVRQRRQRS